MKYCIIILFALIFLNNSNSQEINIKDLYGNYLFSGLSYDSLDISLIQLCSKNNFAIWKDITQGSNNDIETIEKPIKTGVYKISVDTLMLFIDSCFVLEFKVIDTMNISLIPKHISSDSSNTVKAVGHRECAYFPNHTCGNILDNLVKTKWFVKERVVSGDTIYGVFYTNDTNSSYLISDPKIIESTKLFK